MKHPTFNFKVFAHPISIGILGMVSLFLLMLLIPVEAQAQQVDYHLVVKQKNGKFGVKTTSGFLLSATVLPYEYDSLTVLKKQEDTEILYSALKNGKRGVVFCYGTPDKNGVNWIVPCEYDKVFPTLFGYYVLDSNNHKGLYSFNGNVLVPCEFSEIWFFNKTETDYFRVVKDGLSGIAGYGKLIVPCKYDAEDIMDFRCLYDSADIKREASFDNDMAERDKRIKVYCGDGKYGILNDGQIVLPCEYDSINMIYYNKSLYLSKNGESGIRKLYGDGWIVPMGQHKITWGEVNGDWCITVTETNGKSTRIDAWGKPAFTLPGWAQWRMVKDKEINGYDITSQSVNNGYKLYWAAKNSSDKYFTHIVNEKGIPVVNVGTTKIVKMFTVDVMMVSRNGRIGLVDVKTGKVLAPCAHDGVRLCGLVDGVMRYCMYNNTPTGKTYSVYQNGKLLAKATYNRSQIRARNAFMLNWMGGY